MDFLNFRIPPYLEQLQIRANGNGEADFKLHLGTAFLVIENIANNETNKKPIKEDKKPIKEGKKPIKEGKKPIKGAEKPTKDPRKELKKTLIDVLELMRNNPTITYKGIEEKLGIKKTAILGRVKKLKELGLIKREGGCSAGVWIVIE